VEVEERNWRERPGGARARASYQVIVWPPSQFCNPTAPYGGVVPELLPRTLRNIVSRSRRALARPAQLLRSPPLLRSRKPWPGGRTPWSG